MIVLDAFSGGAVPLHLLTREAFALYLERLTPQGVLAVHVSNRHFDVGRVVRATAADLGLIASLVDDFDLTRLRSRWAFVARSNETLRAHALAVSEGVPPAGQQVRTDDYCDLWSSFER